MRRKSLVRKMKTSKSAATRDVEHIYSALCGIKKLPAAAYEGCVLVPFALTACIPETAVRKFAANKAFIVRVNDCGKVGLCFFGSHRYPPFDTKSYQIEVRESSI